MDSKEWIISANGGELSIGASKDAAAGSGGNYFKFVRSTQQVNSLRGVKSSVEWFIIDNSTEEVGIGTTSPSVALEIEGQSKSEGSVAINRFASSINPPYLELNKSRGATKGDFTIVADNDRLGAIQFQGSDGTDFSAGAEISALVDQATPANNDIQAELAFKTGGTTTADINMLIRSSG